ncbi:hypothetical protein ACQKQD_18505 [Methylobacterium sp. NPDC080182]|uniref:hypothetical protein n=1 Tax=Methylobacterium sp. NPDC080182 TaxID=3390590 RepID=UPI003CFCB73A
MRYALAAVAFIAATGQGMAQGSADASFGFREIPCRYYANPKSDPTGDIVDLMPQIWEGVATYVKARGPLTSYPSECAINALVEAECRLTPKASLGTAINDLYAKVKAGRTLPSPHACGA